MHTWAVEQSTEPTTGVRGSLEADKYYTLKTVTVGRLGLAGGSGCGRIHKRGLLAWLRVVACCSRSARARRPRSWRTSRSRDRRSPDARAPARAVVPPGAGVAMSASLPGCSRRAGACPRWGVATTVLVPLTMVRQGYVFSVGYGGAVAAIGATLLAAYRPAPRGAVVARGRPRHVRRAPRRAPARARLTVPAMAARIDLRQELAAAARSVCALGRALLRNDVQPRHAHCAPRRRGRVRAPGAVRGLAQRGRSASRGSGSSSAAADAHKLLVKRRLAVRGEHVRRPDDRALRALPPPKLPRRGALLGRHLRGGRHRSARTRARGSLARSGCGASSRSSPRPRASTAISAVRRPARGGAWVAVRRALADLLFSVAATTRTTTRTGAFRARDGLFAAAAAARRPRRRWRRGAPKADINRNLRSRRGTPAHDTQS